MNPYVKLVEVKFLNGLFEAAIPFSSGLNIISGENGTFKTKLLQEIKAGRFEPSVGASKKPTIQAISPKRNSERRAVEAAFQQLRQQNKTFDTYVTERGGAQINDATFDNYPSIGELFYYLFELKIRDGGSQINHLIEVTDEFNLIIQRVFPDYKLLSEWNSEKGVPKLSILKRNAIEVPIESVSLGEQEVLSLVANLYASRDSYDVFIIDEPEVHLNWHLEKGLFLFFDYFCNEYNKQMIVATHSRVVFLEELLPKTVFFSWNEEGRVGWDKNVTQDQQNRIGGEAIEIIRLGPFKTPTFFVEDKTHEKVIEKIAQVLGIEVKIIVCGNAPNVRSLFKRFKSDSSLGSSFFIEDGDNEGDPFPDSKRFIHLEKYCIENYFFDLRIASSITNKTELELTNIIFDSIISNKEIILGKNKFLDFLIDQLNPEHIDELLLSKLDASLIFPDYLRVIGFDVDEYINKYIEEVTSRDMLFSVFPSNLINAIRSSSD